MSIKTKDSFEYVNVFTSVDRYLELFVYTSLCTRPQPFPAVDDKDTPTQTHRNGLSLYR